MFSRLLKLLQQLAECTWSSIAKEFCISHVLSEGIHICGKRRRNYGRTIKRLCGTNKSKVSFQQAELWASMCVESDGVR